jgi:transposase InsO family protein
MPPHRRHMCQDIGDTYARESSHGQRPVPGRGACAGGRSVSELAAAHGVHRSWIYKLLARYREGGLDAVKTRSRRPRSCKHQTPPQIAAAIVQLRAELSAQGHDAGAETIAYHLAQRFEQVPSVRTIWRILHREGLVAPQPKKRPRSSWRRFCAELPNELWQTDVTAWQLAGGEVVEILNCEDDHSRLFLGSDAYERVKAADVVNSFHKAAALHGLPQSLLSDNGAVFTGSYRGGKVALQYELERLRVEFKNSRPYHPQTLGKMERLHQTLKRYLDKQSPARTLLELQGQLDAFRHYYNHIRPHRAIGRRTPLQAYSARVKARPVGATAATYVRVREDRVDKTGKVSLRFDSRLYKIGLGRAHKGRAVKLLIADQDIRVIDADGELIRELRLDPSRCYQPLTAA